ncbi:MAG: VOC family protein [Rubrivivax sp.]
MRRVTGIGGIFFQARDPKALGAWYKRHLGLDVQEWGGAVLSWADDPGHAKGAMTVWSVGSNGFEPGTAPFMVNYRVTDVRALLATLREEGCQVLDQVEDGQYGIFGWVIDPEGHKVELWQPPQS